MDALQAGCHVFVEKPLSTNVQEAVDIVNVAKGRGLRAGVGHQYRLCPSFQEARARLGRGEIGRLRLVTATLARPWLETHGGGENSWRFDPKVAGGGILADVGDHLLDILLWTTSQVAHEVSAVQDRLESGLDVVTAATVRLSEGTPATISISGVSAVSLFQLDLLGETGRLLVTDQSLQEQRADGSLIDVPLPPPAATIDGDFVSALRQGLSLCCPAEEALDTVRLLEAVTQSASTSQIVRLV
jgi:predicted dehydrogenase